MTKSERTQIANELRKTLKEADGKQAKGIPYQYGWLQTSIRLIADDIEAGKVPKKEGRS